MEFSVFIFVRSLVVAVNMVIGLLVVSETDIIQRHRVRQVIDSLLPWFFSFFPVLLLIYILYRVEGMQ
jgi:hypothetical protein